MKYSQHEEWVAMLRHATDPHNIAGPVTVAEALRADKQLWEIIMHKTRSGIRKNEGVYPVYEAMKANWETWPVQRLLVPNVLATIKAEKDKKSTKRSRDSTSDSSEFEADKKRKKRVYRDDYDKGGSWEKPSGRGKGRGKSKGKGKGKGRGKGTSKGSKSSKGPRMPKLLQGLDALTRNGDPKCFGFNLPDGCKHAGPGGKCNKGLHVCMICGQADHGASHCKKKST